MVADIDPRCEGCRRRAKTGRVQFSTVSDKGRVMRRMLKSSAQFAHGEIGYFDPPRVRPWRWELPLSPHGGVGIGIRCTDLRDSMPSSVLRRCDFWAGEWVRVMFANRKLGERARTACQYVSWRDGNGNQGSAKDLEQNYRSKDRGAYLTG